MSTIFPPQPPRIPIGETADGKPVWVTKEWADYLVDALFRRVGGYNAPPLNEVAARANPVVLFQDAEAEQGPMGPPGPQGPAGTSGVLLMMGADGEDGDMGPPAPHMNTVIVSGKYTPTLTNVANLDASTVFEAQYIRVGPVVTVSGFLNVDPTAVGASTQLGISLPFASNFGATEDCAGVGAARGFTEAGSVFADAGNDRAELRFIAVDANNHAFTYHFTYEII